MTLLLKNAQNAAKLCMTRTRKDILLLRQILSIEAFDMGVMCVDDKTIQCLNKQFRKQDKPTDILAFPFHEGLQPGRLPEPDDKEEYNIGDIYLGIPYLADRCKEENMQLEEAMAIFVTHGLTHLLGYTHEDEASCKLMYDKEMKILERFNELTGSSLKPITLPENTYASEM